MHFAEWSFWGIHALWWLFWITVIAGFVTVLSPWSERTVRRDTPLEILRRRYAAGEITEKEYGERKRALERDMPLAN
jgi:putative membrane protein